MVPAYFFAAAIFFFSVMLNTYNVFQQFAPETYARFNASGFLEDFAAMPMFGPLAFAFRLLAGWALYKLLAHMNRSRKLITNPVWMVMTFLSAYCLFVGLLNLINTIPLVFALIIVAGLQYVEIIFWNARRKSIYLWCFVAAAYGIEMWLQYEMAPFHVDHATFLGLVQGMFSFDFNWLGFQPMQAMLAVIALFGVEFGEKFTGVVSRFS